PDLRQSTPASPAGPGGDRRVPRIRADRAVGRRRPQEGGPAGPSSAGSTPAPRPARTELRASEPLARPDPVVRAVPCPPPARPRLGSGTTPRRARGRAEGAMRVLRRSAVGPMGELLLALPQWRAGFDGRSLIELDYGELCAFMTWDELDDDHSTADLREALD